MHATLTSETVAEVEVTAASRVELHVGLQALNPQATWDSRKSRAQHVTQQQSCFTCQHYSTVCLPEVPRVVAE
jgi:ligand-binding SRPBCC domain-containing protein